jgi:hypothetical protein
MCIAAQGSRVVLRAARAGPVCVALKQYGGGLHTYLRALLGAVHAVQPHPVQLLDPEQPAHRAAVHTSIHQVQVRGRALVMPTHPVSTCGGSCTLIYLPLDAASRSAWHYACLSICATISFPAQASCARDACGRLFSPSGSLTRLRGLSQPKLVARAQATGGRGFPPWGRVDPRRPTKKGLFTLLIIIYNSFS